MKHTLIALLFAVAATCCLQQQHSTTQAMPFDGLLERARVYMEKDLRGCEAHQTRLDDLTLAQIRRPDGDCEKSCSSEQLQYAKGDYRYSGSSVLCCCTGDKPQK